MSIIVFDLETTDLYSCGQILNYCFVHIEDTKTWEIKSTLNGGIELEPHQLPSVDAINTNKIDLIAHCQGKFDNEFLSMSKIYKYLQNIVENDGSSTVLVGHNIAKFDLNFLRTSLIRNGFNPYFGKNLTYSDTIHLAKKYASLPTGKIPSNFKLMTLCKEWLGYDGDDYHDSSSDVAHTINLLKFLQRAGIPVTLQTYERSKYLVRSETGDVIVSHKPIVNLVYFDNGGLFEKPVFKISENKNYALWLDLSSDYGKDGKKSVLWFKKDLASFIVSKNPVSYDILNKAEVAEKFIESNPQTYYNIETFFETPVCDIENHIYMLPFSEIGVLTKLIGSVNNLHLREKHVIGNASTHCVQLYLRYLMRTGLHNDILKKYVHSRYVNQTFIVGKEDRSDTHWSLCDMYKKLNVMESNNKMDVHLSSLRQIYNKFANSFDITLA